MPFASKVLLFITIACSSLFAGCAALPSYADDNASEPSPRQVQVLNNGWAYFPEDPQGSPQDPGFDDSAWETVNVPHSFIEPFWRGREHFGGVGWYRKTLHIPANAEGQRFHLEFEGAFQVTTVYVNGQEVGEHEGGYTAFSYDITDHIRAGQDNTLAVRVNGEWQENIAPRTGDYVFIGGLYRDVYLVTTHPVHVPWYGTFITTPFGGPLVSTTYSLPTHYDTAPVRAQTEIRNDSETGQHVTVHTHVVDAEGNTVAEHEHQLPVPAGEMVEFNQRMTVESPNFWSPEDPYLYNVETEVFIGDELVDTYQTPLGIRWFQATSQEGFWLNGERLRLRGFNVHQDHAGWGYAVPDSGFYRDIRLMKDAGSNFIRGSHYPKDPSLVDACDQFGLILMMELPYWGRGGWGGPAASPPQDSPHFEPFLQNLLQQLESVVRTSRNNPSLIFYSLANEPTGGQLSTTPIHQRAKQLDPTRITNRVTSFSQGIADTYARNGYYPGQSRFPVLFSELWGAYQPRPGEFTARTDPDRHYGMGTAYWPGFDYSTHHDFMHHGTGVVDNARIPKRGWHWHRAAWLGIEPPAWPQAGTPHRLEITSEKDTIGTNGQDDTLFLVNILDADGTHIDHNTTVTLTVVSGPGRFPTGSSIELDSPGGTAGISFRSAEPGTTVVEASAEGIEPAQITVEFVEGGIQVQPQPEPWPNMDFLPDLPNLAQGKPASASTQENNNPASHGTDGSRITRWCAANGDADQWFQVDLRRTLPISGVGVTFEIHADYQYVIETSSDGQTWQTAYDSDGTMIRTVDRHHAFEADARYVRIRYTGLPEGVWASHDEFRIYPAQ